MVTAACHISPKELGPGKRRYAVEYFDSCPTFDILFRDKEVIAFVSDTGATVAFTSYEPHGVSFRRYYYVEVIDQHLAKIKKTIPEIDLIVHNHFRVPAFSSSDIHFLNRMKINGFKGMFAIYFVPLRTVMVYTEKADKNE